MKSTTTPAQEPSDPYWVTVTVNNRPEMFRQPIPDPFARTTVRISWRTRIAALFRRRLVVEVTIGGHPRTVEDVLHLAARRIQ